MAGPNPSRPDPLLEDRLHCLEALIADSMHEINNLNQTLLLSGQILDDAWRGLQPAIARLVETEGDFPAAGLPCSELLPEVGRCIANLRSGAGHVDRLVSELACFSVPQLDVASRSVNLTRLVESTVLLLAGPIRKATGRFELHLEPDLPEFHGDRRGIQQALASLLLDTCRSLPDRTSLLSITTGLDDHAAGVRCEIRDEGTDAPRRGWPAVRRIMEEQGAVFAVEEDRVRGTRVVLSFKVDTGKSSP